MHTEQDTFMSRADYLLLIFQLTVLNARSDGKMIKKKKVKENRENDDFFILKSQWESEFFNSPFPEIFQGHIYCCFASELKQFKVLMFLVKPGAAYVTHLG